MLTKGSAVNKTERKRVLCSNVTICLTVLEHEDICVSSSYDSIVQLYQWPHISLYFMDISFNAS